MNEYKDSPLSDPIVPSNSANSVSEVSAVSAVSAVSEVSEVNSNSLQSNSSNLNSNTTELFEDLQKFYKGRANKNENKSKLFEYDDNGNLIIKNKKDEIIKNIGLPTYRLATELELQDDYQQYLDKLKDATEEFEEARRVLYTAYQTDKDKEEILKLNKNVQDADQHLLEVRFGNYDIELINALDNNIPSEKRVTMRQLYFENAILDKNVYDDVVFVNTRISNISNQVRIAEEGNSVVSISEARKKGKKAGKFNKIMAQLKSSINFDSKRVIPTATEFHHAQPPQQEQEQKEQVEKIIETHPGTIPRPKRLLGSLAAKPKPLPSKQSISDVEQKSFSSGPVSDIKIAVNTALPELTSNKPLPKPSEKTMSALNQFTSLFAAAAPAATAPAAPAAPAAAAPAAPAAPASVANPKSPFNQIKSAFGIATNATNATNATEIKKKFKL